VEITLTEAYKYKINPPIRECTEPESVQGCSLAEIIGPRGRVRRCAVIVAHRHFHTNAATAQKLGLKAGQMVSVKTAGERGLTFNNVLVRIDPSFQSRVHLDTDEANAASVKQGDIGELIINKN
jgi:putative phosphotransacetylase